MTKDRYFERGSPSFFNGKKRQAKCIATYVDPYNSVAPSCGGSCSLTLNSYYDIVDEGTYTNNSNAFRTIFPMIFIKDNNHNVWGLDEDMFDMEDEYSSKYNIELKNQQSSKVNIKKDEVVVEEVDEDDYYEEDEVDDDEVIQPVINIKQEKKIPEPVKIKEESLWIKAIKKDMSIKSYTYVLTLNDFDIFKEELLNILTKNRTYVIVTDEKYTWKFYFDGKEIVIWDMVKFQFNCYQLFLLRGNKIFDLTNPHLQVYIGAASDINYELSKLKNKSIKTIVPITKNFKII